MEKIDLSTNGRAIQKAYEQVVKGEGVSSGSWVIFGPDSTKAYGVVESGTEIDEFLVSFDESQIQFGFSRVNPPGSDVFKNLLIGWCPDSAPLKSRSSFAQNFAEVSKLLKGYHVQITARDSDDLDKTELLSRLSAAAGARYSIQSARSAPESSIGSNFKPQPSPVTKSFKPKPTPVSSNKLFEPPVIKSSPVSVSKAISPANDDDWDEPAIQERDFTKKPLQANTPVWKPVGKVNLQDVIREEKSRPDPRAEIEALKKKERLKKDQEIADYLKSKSTTFNAIKPSLPNQSITGNSDKVIGGISKNFGSECGKTPAQLWAEQKKSKGQNDIEPKPIAQDDSVDNLNDDLSELTTSDTPPLTISSPGFKSAFPAESPGFKEQINPQVDSKDSDNKQEEDISSMSSRVNDEETSHSGSIAPPPPSRTENENAQKGDSSLQTAEDDYIEEDGNVSDDDQKDDGESHEELYTAIAEYDHEAGEDNELTFAEGEKIINIQFIDEDWWIGELQNSGERGLFPSNHVSLIQ